MAANDNAIIEHDDYTTMKDEVAMVRDSISGEKAIKDKGATYLPPPAGVYNDTNAVKTDRYRAYIGRAEFDEFPSVTLESLMGAYERKPPVVNLPPKLDYLTSDIDGNRTSAKNSFAISVSELLQVNYIGLLTEYNGLTNTGIGDNDNAQAPTKAQVKQFNLRPVIKQYSRENIKDWGFDVINGRLQLSFLMLSENTTERDQLTFTNYSVTTDIILALDSDGKYYQRVRRTSSIDKSGNLEFGPAYYPEANGAVFDYIPFDFAFASKVIPGQVPARLGYLSAICKKAIQRYQVKADLREMIHMSGQPTIKATGWTDERITTYLKATGQDTVKLGAGAVMNLPEGCDAEFMSWDADSNAVFKYIEENQKEAEALGARYDTDKKTDSTATQSRINSAKELAVLTTSSNSLTEAYKNQIAYAAAYEGLIKPTFEAMTAYKADINLKLNDDFVDVKLTPQDRDAIRNDVDAMIISKEEAQRQHEAGGLLQRSIEDINTEIENEVI